MGKRGYPGILASRDRRGFYEPPENQSCDTCMYAVAVKTCQRYPMQYSTPPHRWCGEWRARYTIRVELIPDSPPDVCLDCLRYSYCVGEQKGKQRCSLFVEVPKLPELLPLVP